MENDPINLNTESNDIAGNRIDGPRGNTAAKPSAPNTGVGIPGGAPRTDVPDTSSPAAPASSESLADSETGVGKGAVEANPQQQENKEANPDDLKPSDTYGGNFSNSTQGSYRDQARRDNQDSDPNRGEFGAQDLEGTTHGGFGNQNRAVEYRPHGSAEDQYYGGAGRPGVQDNAYRQYDGRDERPDARFDYGFERGPVLASAPGGPAASGAPTQGREFASPNGDNRNQPDRADANSPRQNDNGSAIGPDSGFAADYGHTSLRETTAGRAQTNSPLDSVPGAESRNQTEDYLPTQGGSDKQGRPDAQDPNYATNAPAARDPRGERPASSLGYGDRGREQPRQTPDFATGNDRNGYVQEQANRGDSGQGIGSRGGSYNDAYDDSQPGSKAGSPAQGEQRSEDRDQNYGQEARQENRSDGEANAADHSAPRRNAGRDGEADE